MRPFLLVCALAAGWPAGDARGAAFNGRTSYAVVARAPSLRGGTQLTVAAWVKLRSLHGSQVILNRGRAAQCFTFYLFRGKMRMLVEHRRGRYAYALADPPAPGRWTHYAGAYDGRTIRIYKDGRLAGERRAPGRVVASSAPLYIGALSPFERHLDGWLDDVCLWTRALNEREIAALAASRDARWPAALSKGLVARWTRQSLVQSRWRNLVTDQPDAQYFANPKPVFRKADGYRGIWYWNQKLDSEYVFKYSGGLGTYCAKHIPFAVYSPRARKTFFCYGGTDPQGRTLLHMVSYYDHRTGLVPRPTILMDKQTDDAHDNPVIQLDADGYVWIFSSSHGTARPSFIWRSTEPFSVDAFECVLKTNFSYPQPHYLPGRGFLFLHTRYAPGRFLYQWRSPDGRRWDEPRLLAKIEMGHYQVSAAAANGKVGTAFNFHPDPKGLNWRTNLYYMETDDFGDTWRTADGKPLTLPLTEPHNPALVRDYRAEGLLVYMKDIQFDSRGFPVILYVTSRGFESGPKNDPRTWTTARWTGSGWDIQGHITSDSNYDTGSLYIERDDFWRLIAPTQTGPQPGNPGGEVAMWVSEDKGHSWRMVKQLTHDSEYNHTYVRRPVNAHPDFYAFWADGHARRRSESRLYFTNRDGTGVWRLPTKMSSEFARPEKVW